MKSKKKTNQSEVSQAEIQLTDRVNPLKATFDWMFNNKVVLFFAAISIGAILVSGTPMSFVVSNILTRFARNGFTVLSLLIPVLAGLGLNFSIVIGAMAAQVGVFFAIDWGLVGVPGMLVALLVATPLAMLLGFGVGKLMNKMKGAEMIAGLILGYFAEGFYQLFFLFILGGVIPVRTASNVLAGGVGIKNTIDLTGNLKYALDLVKLADLFLVAAVILLVVTAFKAVSSLKKKEAFPLKSAVFLLLSAVLYGVTFIPGVGDYFKTDRLPMISAIEIGGLITVLYCLFKLIVNWRRPAEGFKKTRYLVMILAAAVLYGLTYIPPVYDTIKSASLAVLPFGLIAGLCVFNRVFLSTRLGQNMRTAGQSQVIANASGIHVDRVRVIAMMISTVLASWGQMIYLQNMGTLSTYGAHTYTGLYAIAALLVGGASVQKATNKQAITGIILFHTLFVVAPAAANTLFNNAMLGEYFREGVSYGVIALALAMHAWQRKKKPALEVPE